MRDLAFRLTGSSDLYGDDGRLPIASINFVTAHDGFTMRDLVSYERKHNEANGEDNRDGTDDNRSYNCGVEGDPAPAEVVQLRLRQARNLLATLLLSTGAPMLVAGDERWRTQRGNNNAYCQDNEVSWLDWSAGRDGRRPARAGPAAARAAPQLTRCCASARSSTAGRRRRRRLQGPGLVPPGGARDDERGLVRPRAAHDRHVPGRSRAAAPRRRAASVIIDDSFLLLLHSGDEPTVFTLPGPPYANRYEVVVDTRRAGGVPDEAAILPGGGAIQLDGRVVLLLRVVRGASVAVVSP